MVPRPVEQSLARHTSPFDATFRAMTCAHSESLCVPVENSITGSVVRVYDLLLKSELTITAETILPIEMNLIGCPGASLSEIRCASSHPMALAQCERFFGQHPSIKRLPAEDTAGNPRGTGLRAGKNHTTLPRHTDTHRCPPHIS